MTNASDGKKKKQLAVQGKYLKPFLWSLTTNVRVEGRGEPKAQGIIYDRIVTQTSHIHPAPPLLLSAAINEVHRISRCFLGEHGNFASHAASHKAAMHADRILDCLHQG